MTVDTKLATVHFSWLQNTTLGGNYPKILTISNETARMPKDRSSQCPHRRCVPHLSRVPPRAPDALFRWMTTPLGQRRRLVGPFGPPFPGRNQGLFFSKMWSGSSKFWKVSTLESPHIAGKVYFIYPQENTYQIHHQPFFGGGGKSAISYRNCTEWSGQIITTSAEVTLNGGLIRELPQNPLNSGLGIILICPEWWFGDREISGTFGDLTILMA